MQQNGPLTAYLTTNYTNLFFVTLHNWLNLRKAVTILINSNAVYRQLKPTVIIIFCEGENFSDWRLWSCLLILEFHTEQDRAESQFDFLLTANVALIVPESWPYRTIAGHIRDLLAVMLF